MADDTSDNLVQGMNAYYERRAPWHDDYMSYQSQAATEQLLAPLLKVIEPLVTGRRVLEIACGTGTWTQVVAERAAQVTATDVSPAMLDLARQKCTGRKNISFVEADAYQLAGVPTDNEVAFAADWWSHIPKQHISTFMTELRRHLAADGMIVMFDMHTNDWFEKEESFIDSHGNRVSTRSLPNGSIHQVVKNFPDEEELRADLGKYFARVEYYSYDELGRWLVVGDRCR